METAVIIIFIALLAMFFMFLGIVVFSFLPDGMCNKIAKRLHIDGN